MNRLTLSACLVSLVIPLSALGQTFTSNSLLFDPPLTNTASIQSVSLADFNGDGRLDLYYPGSLYKQEADGSFKEVLKATGIDFEGDAPRGGVFGDANFDGLLDLFILDSVPGSRIFFNRTGGKFYLGNFIAGIQLNAPPLGGFWRDVNFDGWIDFVANFGQGNHALLAGFSNGRYFDYGPTYGFRSGGGSCFISPGDYDRDGDTDVYVSTCSGPNELLNQSGGPIRARFANTGATAGVASTLSSRRAGWFDFDNDGWLDLIVANNSGGNLFYHNQRNGRFIEKAAQVGLQGGAPNIGETPLVVADFNNDGWQDVYLPAGGLGKLYRNNRNGTFTDIFGAATGLQVAPGVTEAGDFNNDGWMDLFFPGEGILFNDGGINNWLTVEVKDDVQNRFGVGAMLLLTTDAGIQTRVIEAGTGGLGHGDLLKAHFGLGSENSAASLEIRWPTGAPEVFTNLAANKNHVFVRGIGPNEPPATFMQTMPLIAEFINTSTETIQFEWQPSVDTDPIKYTLSVSGPGVSLSFVDLDEPFFELSTSLLPANQVFSWSVRATDGHSVRYSGEERIFTFGQAGTAVSTLPEPRVYDFGLPLLANGVIRFSDVDGDHDLDVLVGGEGPTNGILNLYKTDDRQINLPGEGGSYIFKYPVNVGSSLRAVSYPRASFGDMNSDGNLDLAISGISSITRAPETTFYVNNGTDLVLYRDINIPNVWGGAVEWGDVEGDGDLDLLISGATRSNAPFLPTTQVILGDGGSSWAPSSFFLPGIMFGDADWSDMDGDGDLDVALTGDKGQGEFFSAIFRNDGDRFVDIKADLPPLIHGSIAWVDFDLDGDQDLYLTGGMVGPELIHGRAGLFINEGGVFVRHPFPFDGVYSGEAIWGDYDSDGDPDLFVTGNSNPYQDPVGRLFRNENGQFVAELDVIGLGNSSAAFGDYNGDGDVDLVVMGRDDFGSLQIRFMINLRIPELVPPQ